VSLRGPDEDWDDADRIEGKSTHDLPPGTTVSLRTPGGGGYGDPADRDLAAVARDLRLGKLSPAVARDRYGTVADDALAAADVTADGSSDDSGVSGRREESEASGGDEA
jgi:N-methylhydantoinase B